VGCERRPGRTNDPGIKIGNVTAHQNDLLHGIGKTVGKTVGEGRRHPLADIRPPLPPHPDCPVPPGLRQGVGLAAVIKQMDRQTR
jgi:hypothetical protein